MSITTATQTLLDAHLATVSGIPSIQTENTRFTDVEAPWVRTTLLPALSALQTVGANAVRKYMGIYQVDVIYPEDVGFAPGRTMADAVVAAFPIGLFLTDGTITVQIEMATAMSALPLLTFTYIPVQIQWAVYA